jgi:hypothetical protein
MYIVIEAFNVDWPTIVVDITGKPLLFYTRKEAIRYAAKLQRGVVVKI